MYIRFIHIFWAIQATELSIKLKDVDSDNIRRAAAGGFLRMITLLPGRQFPVFKT